MSELEILVGVIAGAGVAEIVRKNTFEELDTQFPVAIFSAVAQKVPCGTEFPVLNNSNLKVLVEPRATFATTYTGRPSASVVIVKACPETKFRPAIVVVSADMP